MIARERAVAVAKLLTGMPQRWRAVAQGANGSAGRSADRGSWRVWRSRCQTLPRFRLARSRQQRRSIVGWIALFEHLAEHRIGVRLRSIGAQRVLVVHASEDDDLRAGAVTEEPLPTECKETAFVKIGRSLPPDSTDRYAPTHCGGRRGSALSRRSTGRWPCRRTGRVHSALAVARPRLPPPARRQAGRLAAVYEVPTAVLVRGRGEAPLVQHWAWMPRERGPLRSERDGLTI